MAAVTRALRVAVTVPLALSLLVGCGSDEPPPPAPPPAPASPAGPAPSASAAPGPTGDPAERAQAAVKTLTDAQLAGQVLMPYAYGDAADRVDKAAAAGNQRIAGV